MQSNNLPRGVNFLIFWASCVFLLADAVFIGWATQLDLLVAVPAALSAVYLMYVAAHFTILERHEG